jgi:hypothetical protein
MPIKTDLSTTIAGVIPLLVVLLAKVGVPLDSETQMAIVGLTVMFVSYFVGKPSAETKRLRRMIVEDNILGGDEN